MEASDGVSSDEPTGELLPRVDLFALGGTIASVPVGSEGSAASGAGARPELLARDLVAAVPQVAAAARVEATQFLQVPSCEITLSDLFSLVDRMRDAVDAGADGIVVTQGTDTLEESAFVVDLLWDRPQPVVFTGAMRTPATPGADGPANLLAAVRTAACGDARDLGVLVCLGDEIHAARWVRKSHTSSPAAFASPGLGPLGWVSEGRPRIVLRPTSRRPALRVEASVALPRVSRIPIGLGDDGHLLEALEHLDVDGVVVEGVGGGHVPSALVPVLVRLVERMPVLLASRTGAGAVLGETYGYPGGEMDLLARGLVGTGDLDAARARLLLSVGLAAGLDREGLELLL